MLLTSLALQNLKPLGYQMFTQKRIGTHGVPFFMTKIQTMQSQHEPHQKAMGNKAYIHPSAKLIRLLAIDELIQIFHVSDDDTRPGQMMFLGTHRPQLSEELHLRERTLVAHGFKRLARDYMEVCDASIPAVFAPESFAKFHYEPATPEYYKFCAESAVRHFRNASFALDMQLFAGVLAVGAHLLAPPSGATD